MNNKNTVIFYEFFMKENFRAKILSVLKYYLLFT